MDREQAIQELKKAQENTDTDGGHRDADDVLCRLLSSLGYEDVVAEYEKVDKWFA